MILRLRWSYGSVGEHLGNQAGIFVSNFGDLVVSTTAAIKRFQSWRFGRMKFNRLVRFIAKKRSSAIGWLNMETENMNKLVEWKALVDTLWIKSASYAKVQVIQ